MDDRAYSGSGPAQLRSLLPEDYEEDFLFVADRTALASDGYPILVVPVPDEDEDEDARPRTEFRVVATELWSVENNLSIANMDWGDFSDNVGDDGVFRGF
ncbi:DUF6924 domain-containing protein [Pseudonocardia sp. HH130630-07]|uniref:DUF6924 domain-containing protein n=1 Tax=Pseudonocardia sp. HH130630-07 TaxID=1690815 RepID=UPI0008153A0D|nr:hypothetical protein [Pseudonocardia sp. HH130630-07]ANY08834.1 hypothetical protein AFB00_24105 [Pseudonocardia sp. HH130630-07]